MKYKKNVKNLKNLNLIIKKSIYIKFWYGCINLYFIYNF